MSEEILGAVNTQNEEILKSIPAIVERTCEAYFNPVIDRIEKSMEGIYTTSISLDTLDEAPQAYKSVEDILDVVGETVDVIEVLKPVYNYKEHGNEKRNY